MSGGSDPLHSGDGTTPTTGGGESTGGGEPTDTEKRPSMPDPLATTRPDQRPFDTDREPPSLPTSFIERYQVKRLIGTGGMGAVYEALDANLHRVVALKVLKLDEKDPKQFAEAANRLVREARAMAVLSHRNVVTVYDVGIHGQQVFVAMQLVDGMTFRQWLGAAPRSLSQILQVLVDAGNGLAGAHAARLIHRDFKPDNVLVSRRGTARVTDFGLARRASFDVDDTWPERTSRPKVVDVETSDNVTRSGAVLGTPAYMAPEQTQGRPCDARADQFSFCVTAWEALFGTRPFGGATWSEIYGNVIAGNITEPDAKSRVPRAIEKALRRGLSVAPNDRFVTMTELLDILETGIVKRKLWPRLVAISLASAAVAVAVTWIATRDHQPAESPAAETPPPPNETTTATPSTRVQTEPYELPMAPPLTNATPIAKAKLGGGEHKQHATAVAPVTKPAAPPVQDEPPAPALLDSVRAKRKTVADELARRALRVADLPEDGRTALASADAAIAAGDAGKADVALQVAERAIAAVVIDHAFINAKLSRINKQLAKSAGREAELRSVYAQLKTLVQAGKYGEANALLNDMADRLAK